MFSTASRTSLRVTLWNFILSGETSTWYSVSSPPITDTWLTPPSARMRGDRVRSAILRNSLSEVESAVRPIIIISPRIEDCGPRVGEPTPGGSCDAISESFSLTVWRARYTSSFQSNSIHTTEKPVAEEERTRRTPDAPLSAVSIG